MHVLPWIFALVGVALLASIATLLVLQARQRPRVPTPLPTDWPLAPRPVFSADERRAYRLLREALPEQVVLAKLPLVRFCKPVDPAQARYWYELLGGVNVTFAVCSTSGRVLAAIDLVSEGGGSRRTTQIKEAVLGACRVRHLRCPADKFPSVSELQLLVPRTVATPPRPRQVKGAPPARVRDSLLDTAAFRRSERAALWQDSGALADSFFAPDSRVDSLAGSQFAALSATDPDDGFDANGHLRSGRTARDDIAGVVVDASPAPAQRTGHRL